MNLSEKRRFTLTLKRFESEQLKRELDQLRDGADDVNWVVQGSWNNLSCNVVKALESQEEFYSIDFSEEGIEKLYQDICLIPYKLMKEMWALGNIANLVSTGVD